MVGVARTSGEQVVDLAICAITKKKPSTVDVSNETSACASSARVSVLDVEESMYINLQSVPLFPRKPSAQKRKKKHTPTHTHAESDYEKRKHCKS